MVLVKAYKALVTGYSVQSSRYTVQQSTRYRVKSNGYIYNNIVILYFMSSCLTSDNTRLSMSIKKSSIFWSMCQMAGFTEVINIYSEFSINESEIYFLRVTCVSVVGRTLAGGRNCRTSLRGVVNSLHHFPRSLGIFTVKQRGLA